MKKIFLSTLFLLGTILISNAQEAKIEGQSVRKEIPQNKKFEGKVEKQNKRASEMDEVVGLTTKQKVEVANINMEQNTKMKTVRLKYAEQKAEGRESMQAEIKEIQKERKTRTKEVLTPEQKQKWKQHQKSKKEKLETK